MEVFAYLSETEFKNDIPSIVDNALLMTESKQHYGINISEFEDLRIIIEPQGDAQFKIIIIDYNKVVMSATINGTLSSEVANLSKNKIHVLPDLIESIIPQVTFH